MNRQLFDVEEDPREMRDLARDARYADTLDELTGLLKGGAGDDEGAINALVEAANEAGGHDNITAALIRLG